MAQQNSQGLVAAQILGITSSAFLSSFAFTASYLGIGAAALAPVPLRLRQWQLVFDLGKPVSPTLSVATAGVWAYLAYTSYNSGSPAGTGDAVVSKSLLYSIAAAGTGSVLVYTALFILPTNNQLMELNTMAAKDGAGAVSEAEVKALLQSWKSMTYVRAVLPMVGAVAGAYAALS